MRRVSIFLSSMVLAGIGLSVLGREASAATVKVGKSCAVKSLGVTAIDATGQSVVCTKVSRSAAQWKLPALGSFLRPIPLGSSAEAGPAKSRFRIRVTSVDFAAATAVAAISPEMTPPPDGTQYVRVAVEATFAGPGAAGSTDHVWYTRDASGANSASSEGCGGGFGTDFDVTAVMAKGQAVTGFHCFQVPVGALDSLRLWVDGFGNPPVHFSLR